MIVIHKCTCRIGRTLLLASRLESVTWEGGTQQVGKKEEQTAVQERCVQAGPRHEVFQGKISKGLKCVVVCCPTVDHLSTLFSAAVFMMPVKRVSQSLKSAQVEPLVVVRYVDRLDYSIGTR
jgi:hypothetical protein